MKKNNNIFMVEKAVNIGGLELEEGDAIVKSGNTFVIVEAENEDENSEEDKKEDKAKGESEKEDKKEDKTE